MKRTYRHTLWASYLGYITQAICNNLPSLLFVTFHTHFGISLEQLGLLVSINFGIQLVTDLAAAKFVDRVGYRVCVVAAEALSVAGLVLMGILPFVMAQSFTALLIPTALNAVGGGLLEVLVSPIVEALPGEQKEKTMSLLHSFYCWGHVCVVLLSTAYFAAFGMGAWRYLPMLWAVVPLFNAFLYASVPLAKPVPAEKRMPVKSLFASGSFRLFLLMMVCAGASEQSMSQWSSLFAESGLGVTKAMGDLLGPCMFALLMGFSRLIYGFFGSRLKIRRALYLSAGLCVMSYLLSVFSPLPILALVGCALAGFTVGLMWPGTFSLTAAQFPAGGTAMFAFLALAGDLGCSLGPGLVGFVSGAVESTGSNFGLRGGILAAGVFPLTLFVCALILARRHQVDIAS